LPWYREAGLERLNALDGLVGEAEVQRVPVVGGEPANKVPIYGVYDHYLRE
jgi:hypothetical protein